MRWQDMIPGEAYVLATDPSIKVTLLNTPDELRAQARVRVRFENGVSAGREADIPSRRIGAAWDRTLTPPKRPVVRAREANVVPLSRPARVGDSVMLTETGELIWTVDAIDQASSTATVRTVIFERPDCRTVALDELQVRPDPARDRGQRRASPPASSQPKPAPVDPAVEAAERLRPIAPRRELDELMDDVYFTDRCLRAYQQRLGGGPRTQALVRLREEVRRKGYLMRDTPPRPGEYARVRVGGRFDIVLARKPTPEASVTIDSLYFPARKAPRRRRPPRGRDQRRAA